MARNSQTVLYVSWWSHRSESVTSISPAGKNRRHLSKNKMHCKNFYGPKESFEKMSWHSNNLLFMKQFSLVNK